MKEGRKKGRKREGREGGKGRKEIKQWERHCRPGSRGLHVDFFFLREEKKKKISKGEEERGRERGRVNGNIALFWKKLGINNGQSMFHLN